MIKKINNTLKSGFTIELFWQKSTMICPKIDYNMKLQEININYNIYIVIL